MSARWRLATLAPGASAGVTVHFIYDTLVLLLHVKNLIPFWKENRFEQEAIA
jgi:hypothetical protein